MAGVAIASLVAASAPIAVLVSQAEAVSATCTAWKTTIQRTGVDDNYASARCSTIGWNTKVRAKLDVNLDSDVHSVWFTRIGYTYSTPTMSCIWGCSAKYELAATS